MRQHLAIAPLVAAALAAPVAPLQGQGAGIYRPDSAWAVDYGDDYCRLIRDFSNGRDTIGLSIDRTQPGPFMRLILVGDALGTYRGADQLGYRMLPDGAPRTAQRLRTQGADGVQYLNLGPTMLADMPQPQAGEAPAPPPAYTREGELDAARAVTGIALERGFTRPAQIETGPLDGAIEALQTCTDELVAHWGLDAEAHRTLSQPVLPAGPTAGWLERDTIGFADFPRLGGGNNELRVMVDKAGRPTSCHVHWPSLDEATNETICAGIMEQGRFTPALDSAGEPVDSFWMTSPFLLMPAPGR